MRPGVKGIGENQRRRDGGLRDSASKEVASQASDRKG